MPSSQTFRSLTKLNRLARDAAEQIDGERLRVLPATVPVADKLRGGHIRKLNTNYGRFFRELANSGGAPVRDFNVVPPRRIVRACMPRGSGKGALLHILQQPVDSGDRRHLDMLFEDPSPKGMNRYHGAFCLHLSFSMEFASVISALSEFVEHALVGVLVEHTKAVLDAIPRLAALNPEFEKSFPGILYANQAAITAPLVTYLAKDAKTLSPKKLIA